MEGSGQSELSGKTTTEAPKRKYGSPVVRRLLDRSDDAQKSTGKSQRTQMKRRKEELVVNGGCLDIENESEAVQWLLRYRHDGTVEVHKWVSEIRWKSLQELAFVCKEGSLENEDMPRWTKKANTKLWQEVLNDVGRGNAFTKSIMWRSTDFLRHVVSEKGGREAITFTYVCEHCKLYLLEDSCGGLAPAVVRRIRTQKTA